MQIFFLAGRCIPIHAESLSERPLGGTETALIRVAEILQQRGHQVTVFTSQRSPPPSAPVYLPLSALKNNQHCDVTIAVQDWWGVFYPIQCKRRLYWTGDASDQYMNFGLGDRRVIARIDLLLGVSTWHLNNLCQTSGFPISKGRVVGNGVHLPWFAGEEERSYNRLIYSSAPNRGLELALIYFKELRAIQPELELHIFSGFELYDREHPFQGQEKDRFELIRQHCQAIPGVILHGNIKQQQLAREYMKSGLFFYPALIPETFCITAAEALAAGCPALCSALGGLPETVADGGIVISGTPGSDEYNRSFLEAAKRILSDQELWQKLSAYGRKRATDELSWEQVADRIEQSLA